MSVEHCNGPTTRTVATMAASQWLVGPDRQLVIRQLKLVGAAWVDVNATHRGGVAQRPLLPLARGSGRGVVIVETFASFEVVIVRVCKVQNAMLQTHVNVCGLIFLQLLVNDTLDLAEDWRELNAEWAARLV